MSNAKANESLRRLINILENGTMDEIEQELFVKYGLEDPTVAIPSYRAECEYMLSEQSDVVESNSIDISYSAYIMNSPMMLQGGLSVGQAPAA